MNTLWDILLTAFNAITMQYAFVLFFQSFAESKKRKGAVVAIHIITSLAIILALWRLPVGMIRSLLLVFFPFAVSLTFSLKWKSRILLPLLAFGIGSIGELLVAALLSTVFVIDVSTATRGLYQVVGIVLSKIFFLLFVAIIRLQKYHMTYRLSIKQLIALIAIPLASLSITLVHVNWIAQFPPASQPMASANIVSYVILLVSNVIVFQIIDTTYKNTLKDRQIATATELVHAQTKQYEQIQQQNHEVLKLRHDFKNYLIGMISMLESGEIDASLDSLRHEYQRLALHGEFDCMNNIILTTIKIKSEQASLDNIAVHVNYKNIDAIKVSPVDVAIMLGNALDNAIEATQNLSHEYRHINVTVNVVNDLICIIITNPTNSAVDVNNLVSSKRNNGSLGYGIASIRNLALKYDGDVLIACQDNVFKLKLILRNSDE